MKPMWIIRKLGIPGKTDYPWILMAPRNNPNNIGVFSGFKTHEEALNAALREIAEIRYHGPIAKEKLKGWRK